jgi:hypothetical protein
MLRVGPPTFSISHSRPVYCNDCPCRSPRCCNSRRISSGWGVSSNTAATSTRSRDSPNPARAGMTEQAAERVATARILCRGLFFEGRNVTNPRHEELAVATPGLGRPKGWPYAHQEKRCHANKNSRPCIAGLALMQAQRGPLRSEACGLIFVAAMSSSPAAGGVRFQDSGGGHRTPETGDTGATITQGWQTSLRVGRRRYRPSCPRKRPSTVTPAEAGVHGKLDSRFRGNDCSRDSRRRGNDAAVGWRHTRQNAR